MKNSKTKSAVWMSAISLVLCVAMLIGTTFAWFTDSATSGVNTIKAGNLDVEVSYEKTSGNWVSIQDESSLFSGSLWEPGHTEFVTLKVENKGTLAFKYMMNVTPVSESGGINVSGASFKLSDYLYFGTTAAAESAPSYTRETARAAATVQKLNQSNLTQNGTILANGAAQYITLVVYMPETVGNEANYKTGTTAPYVDLGITVTATQLQSESDSFDNTYDSSAEFGAGADEIEYNYFPQIYIAGQLKISGTEVQKGDTAGTETSVTKINETTSKVVLASAEQVESNTAAKLTAVVNRGTLDDSQTGSMTLKIVKDDTANANFQSAGTNINTSTQDSDTYQITVECEGVTAVEESTDKALYQVELFIGKNRSNVVMYHNGTPMTEATSGAAETYSYSASTGYVTMYVNSFSPFTAVYNKPIDVGATYFSGGKGTEEEPYLIGTAEQMQNISNAFDLGGTAYYKIADGVKTIDCKNWSPVYLNGSFDGNGVVFTNLDNTLFQCISNSNWEIIENATIQNFRISDAEIINNGWKSVVVRTAATTNCTFKNINVSGYIEGATGVATFVCFGPGNYDSDYSAVSHFVFENCSSTVTTVAASGCAVGFIAHAMADAGSTIQLKNSSYNGSMSATSLGSCKYAVGNWYNGTITDDNTAGADLYNSSSNGWTYTASGKRSVLTTATGVLPNLGETFSVNKVEGATKAVVAFSVSPNAKPDEEHASDWGCLTSTYYSEAAVTATTFTSTDIKYVTVRVNPEGVAETGFHGNYYDIVADWAGHSIGSATVVRFIQYDANGNILCITTFNFNDK